MTVESIIWLPLRAALPFSTWMIRTPGLSGLCFSSLYNVSRMPSIFRKAKTLTGTKNNIVIMQIITIIILTVTATAMS